MIARPLQHLLPLACLACLACVTALAWAGRADYVGPKECGSCHQEAYEVWLGSAHARAGETLGASPAGECLACHTTGDAPAGRPFFSGVTCESCHGAGAGYAAEDVMKNPELSRLVGLRDLSTPALRDALCAGCHRGGTRLVPFDPRAGYEEIEHR